MRIYHTIIKFFQGRMAIEESNRGRRSHTSIGPFKETINYIQTRYAYNVALRLNRKMFKFYYIDPPMIYNITVKCH